jgi:uncharacterized protein (TIGR00290 family)
MGRSKVWLSWSSGKDSAWALHVLRASTAYEVTALLTTINQDAGRVAMHAVRECLLEAQAAAAGLPLIKIPIPAHCSNATYESAMRDAMTRARNADVSNVAFGDLFLEDIRLYRIEKLAAVGITPIFPIWGRDTRALANEMIAAGLRAHITCVDPKQLHPDFAGRSFDAQFIGDLPPGVDPCGENGEFHSCVFAGPMFAHPLQVVPGEIVQRDNFVFADLQLAPGI